LIINGYNTTKLTNKKSDMKQTITKQEFKNIKFCTIQVALGNDIVSIVVRRIKFYLNSRQGHSWLNDKRSRTKCCMST